MDNEFENPPAAAALTPSKAATSPVALYGGIAVAILALLLAVGGWLSSVNGRAELTQSLGGRIAEIDRSAKDVASRNEALLRDLRDAQNRVAQLEGKLAELQNQRVAIEEMTRDLARAPEDWLLAEIEQTLNIASRELILAGNVRAAIVALQTADQRLSRAEKVQAAPLRRAITQDLERLKAIPAIDTQGIALKLDNLSALASTLPLAVPTSMKDLDGLRPSGLAESKADLPWWRQMWRDFAHEMSDLIRIRELEPNEAALITPQQAIFVRENLKLRLLSARTSLLARDEVNFKEDLKTARELVAKYFDQKAKVNQNAIASLRLLADNAVSIAAPDIVQSLNAVRAARAARERPGR
ncbi:MAG: uroporphyrinogen-III C-methyltransferase [Aeromicrobium sp.]|nr:uroporphyrinogen-III C-methyltransferase [Burkholderiales bacterium]